MTEAPLLQAHDLHVRFNTVRAVDGVSLFVHQGETLAIVGESGCGKTTLGRTLAMLQKPVRGKVTFNGAELTSLPERRLRAARRQLQMVFQDPYASLDPRQRVSDIVGEPLLIAGVGKAARQKRVAELLDMVGLGADMGSRFPREFSGGQRQRIGIARALAIEPRLIICDEPLSALDVSIQAQIVNLLIELQRRFRLTYVFISHDLAVVRQMASRVAVMYLGKIVELAETERLFRAPRHPYTVALLSAVPTLAAAGVETPEEFLLAGDPPSPSRVPAGCRFHTRCWLRTKLGDPSQCVTSEPEAQGGDAHSAACHFSERITPSVASHSRKTMGAA